MSAKRCITETSSLENFDAPENDEKWYPEKDYHTMYIGEILKVLVKEG